MVSVQLFLTVMGGVIVLGFLGNLFFKITHIPTPVLLILCGLFLRPLIGSADQAMLYSIAPYFGTVALLLILFEGGLDLDFHGVLRQVHGALFFAVGGFVLCAAALYALLHLAAGLPPADCLLYALILSGASPSVLLPTLNQMSIPKDLKTFLTIESTVTELLTVVGTILFIEMSNPATPPLGVGGALWHILAVTSSAVLWGGLAGLAWRRFLPSLAGRNFAYMLTLGVLLLFFGFAEGVGAKGTLAVLFFGLVFGDAPSLVRKLPRPLQPWLLKGIQPGNAEFEAVVRSNSELSFLVRSFFFVFLGMLIDLSAFSSPTAILLLAGVGATVFATRWAVTKAERRLAAPGSMRARGLVLTLAPRGLANTVVAFTALQAGVLSNGLFLQVVLGIVLLTNLVMAASIFYWESRAGLAVTLPPPL